jgi:His/Glu/Gln/Arg/opine family amino acid ABC transporter permease subunit
MDKIYQDFYNSIIYQDRYLYILEGVKNTILIALFAVILGIIIGIIIALTNNYYKETKRLPILNWLGKFYVTVIRGTPSLLQLMIIYYVVFRTVDVNLLIVGSLSFGINSGAYVSEIIRAGIESIDVGQKEAGYALGLSYSKVMQKIVLPQAIKNILPALGNEFITLLKETSVASYIGILELTKAGDIIASRTYNYFFPLIIVAIIYLILTTGLARLLKVVEGRLK